MFTATQARHQPAEAIHSSIASRSLVPPASVRQPVARSKSADRSTSVRRCGAHQAQVGIDRGSVCARSLTVLAEMIASWSSPHLCKLPCHWQRRSGRASGQLPSNFRRSRCPPPLRPLLGPSARLPVPPRHHRQPGARVPAQPSHHRPSRRGLSRGPPHPPTHPRTASTTTSTLRREPSA